MSEDGTSRSVGSSAIVGVGVGLVLIVASLSSLFFRGSHSVSAAEQLAHMYEVSEFPFGLSLQEPGFLLPGGEHVFVLSDGTVPVEEAQVEELLGADEEAGEKEGEEPEKEPFDWSAIEVLSTDSAPTQVYIAHYPVDQATGIIQSQFQSLDWKELSGIDADGDRAVVDGGKLRWAGYAADFVRERQFIKGGTFRDSMRVNISTIGECWIAYAIWPTGHAGSEERLVDLLASLQPHE
ncbi:MAG: hypothetical protein ACI8X5_002204 [Planctomycetota bacterium]|jgi:hypothetical protein